MKINFVYVCTQTTELLKNLSPAATWTFWTIDQNRDRHTNIVFLIGLPVAESKKVQRGIKELIAKDVVIKLPKRQQYLINPKVLLPNFDDYQTVLDYWISKGGSV